MTFKNKITGRRGGRHALRSPAAVAALVGVHHDQSGTIEVDSWQVTNAARTALAHTTQEWNALRHAV